MTSLARFPAALGYALAADAPVIRIHLVNDHDRGLRIFIQYPHHQLRGAFDQFGFLLRRRAVTGYLDINKWHGDFTPKGLVRMRPHYIRAYRYCAAFCVRWRLKP